MRIRFAMAVVASVLAFGCSDSDSSGKSCDDSEQCPSWRCTCTDGTSMDISACIMGSCGEGDLCEGNCDERGGLASATEVPSLRGTAECTAVCDKLASMSCDAHSCVHRYCDIGSHDCEASVREELLCMVSDKATWSCQNGFASVTGCYGTPSVCQSDSGAD